MGPGQVQRAEVFVERLVNKVLQATKRVRLWYIKYEISHGVI